jgi:hypothetical protein
MYLRKKLVKKPKVAATTKEIEYQYECIHKQNYMNNNGCPSPDKCKGYKPVGIRIINPFD